MEQNSLGESDNPMGDIKVFQDVETLTTYAVREFINLSQRAIDARGYFSVALSGGSTPRPVYQTLADPKNQNEIAWSNVHLFWGDERHVPPDHTDSNYRMVKQVLIDKVPVPPDNVYRVAAEMDVRMAAFHYEERLRCFFTGGWPRFDLIFLGMGTDGHTASLFPHSAGLNEEYRWFIANFAPQEEEWRLTLTKNAINHARQICVLVQGEDKAEMVSEVFTGEKEPYEKPIQFISPSDGQITWLMDQAAASRLPEGQIS